MQDGSNLPLSYIVALLDCILLIGNLNEEHVSSHSFGHTNHEYTVPCLGGRQRVRCRASLAANCRVSNLARGSSVCDRI